MRRARPRLVRLDARDCLAAFGNPWPSPDLTLSFAPDGTDVNGSPSALDSLPAGSVREILRAAQTWVAAANVNVGLVADGGQPFGTAGPTQGDARFGDLRVAAAPLSPTAIALGTPYDPAAGTRGGDVWLNSSQSFGPTPGFDLYSVALHEFGHTLGIPGSDDPASAMFQAAVVRRTRLAAADAAAAVALYGPRQPDVYERRAGNETTATAPEIQPGGPNLSSDVFRITADLTTAADVDAYRFRPKNLRGGGLTLGVRVAGKSLLAPHVEVRDANGNVVAAGDGARPGAGDVVLHLANPVEGATYYVRVTAGTDAAFAVGGYGLDITPDALGSSGGGSGELLNPDARSNDTLATASQLGQEFLTTDPRQDYSVAASLGDAADVDFYRLKSPQSDSDSAGVLTATVRATGPAGLDPVLDLYDKRGNRVAAPVLAHDGGAFTLQVPAYAENEDFYVAVRHAPGNAATGNYALGVDFGGLAAPLAEFMAGTLTPAAPVARSTVTVSPAQVLHLVLGNDSASAAERLSVLDAAGTLLDSRLAPAGSSASLNVTLAPGDYTLLVAGGPGTYTVRGLTLSDPIGPQPIAADTPPPPVPPTSPPPPPPPPVVTVTPPQPLTPVTPVSPTPPDWLVVPPTDWPAPPEAVLTPAPPRPKAATTFAVGDASGGTVRSFNADGSERFSVAAFPGFAGGVRTAEADFNGDGVADVVTGTGPGRATAVRVLDGATQKELFAVAPFEAAFTGGVYVAAGDVTADGVADLVITPDEGGGPRVRVFNGTTFAVLADFFGIDDPAFRGGARAAVGDVNGDGAGDLIVAAGFQGGPRVAGYDGKSLGGVRANVFPDFFAFEQTLRNGVFLAVGDLDGDGRAEVIAGGGPGGGPRVTAFGGSQLLGGQFTPVANFFAGDAASRDGVRVAVKDFDGDARADLVVGVAGRVTAYLGKDIGAGGTPAAAFDVAAGGVYVG